MFKNNKILTLGIILFALVWGNILFGSTSTPWDGTTWDTAAPGIDELVGNHYKEIYDLRKGIAIRMNKEHETLATSSAGGVHKQGSARAFFQDAAPTTQVNGDAFDSGDLGSFWFDSNTAIDNTFYVLTATTPTWTPVSTEITATMVAAAHSWAEVQTFDKQTVHTLGILSNADITLGAGDDLVGSATSDIKMNTDKFTVAGDTGNTVVAGTLGMSANSATLTHSGTTSLTVASTSGTVIVESVTFTGGAITGVTSLTVDNIVVNGNDISTSAGTDLTLTPLAGQQVVIDGGAIFDAGAVTGITSLTAGATVVNASGVTLAAGDDLIGSATSAINMNNFDVDEDGVATLGTSLDIAGTIAVVGTLDDDTMGTATDTTIATSESIKAYVDALDPAYTGGESHTFPGGLIMKMGQSNADPSDNTRITFGTAFPNALICLQLTGYVESDGPEKPIVQRGELGDVSSKTGFIPESAGATYDGYNWTAWGH